MWQTQTLVNRKFLILFCLSANRLRKERLLRIERYKQRLALLLPPPSELGRNDTAPGNWCTTRWRQTTPWCLFATSTVHLLCSSRQGSWIAFRITGSSYVRTVRTTEKSITLPAYLVLIVAFCLWVCLCTAFSDNVIPIDFKLESSITSQCVFGVLYPKRRKGFGWIISPTVFFVITCLLLMECV